VRELRVGSADASPATGVARTTAGRAEMASTGTWKALVLALAVVACADGDPPPGGGKADDTDTTDTDPPADDTDGADTDPPADDTDTDPPVDDTDGAETDPPVDDTDGAETDPPVDDTDGADTDPPADDTDGADTDPPADDTDATETDAEETDPAETDAVPPVPLAGFGAVTGDCGVLDDAEWSSSDPFLFRAAVDFGAVVFDPTLLSQDAQQILAEGTLGGSSGESEALAFDLLYRCELAELIASESRVVYRDPAGKKTDILVGLDGQPVGVSVTRALTFVFPAFCAPVNGPALEALIERKVSELQLSEANADPTNAWERSMLYVVACDDAHADEVERVFGSLTPNVRGDAILIVTTTDGDDAFLY
jgi:hypothetical protein